MFYKNQNKFMKISSSREFIIFCMKITVFQLALALSFSGISLAHDSKAQGVLTTKITLETGQTSLRSALQQLENAGNVKFVYSSRIVPVETQVSVHSSGEELQDVLTNLLSPYGIGYEVIDDQIVLMKEPGMIPVRRTDTSRHAERGSPRTVPGMALMQQTITGKVTDAESGEILPGVSVTVKGTTTGVSTDMEGNYSISVPDPAANPVLVFSFLGYTSQEVPVGTETVINVSLKQDVAALEQVVVVGYGTTERRNLTSAVTTVESKDFIPGAHNSPLQMIKGKVAGVSVSNPAAADPNRGTDIQVRGASSIEAGNGPLIIIDGVPGGNLNNVAQQDIASITVLRDGSAAAIYGSRAANGVILVTTKSGKAGDVSVTYDSYIEHDVVAAKPDILSPEEFLEHGIDRDLGARTNWYDQLIRKNNFGQNHYLAVSGGSENTIFRISGNFRDKTAIDIASERQEYGIRANFQQKALDGLLEFDGNFTYRFAGEEYTNYGVFQQAVKLNPTIPIFDPESPTGYSKIEGYDVYNPVQNLLERENGADQTYSIADFNVKLNLLENLNTELKLARQSQDELRREYYTSKSEESIDNDRTGRARLENEKWVDWTLEWIGNYFTTIDKHDIRVMGGYSYQEFNNRAFWAENADFPTDAVGYDDLGGGLWNNEEGRLGMDSWRSKEKTIAFFGRLNYSFDDTWLFMGSLRYEGNSKFGAENKWGLFPAASAAWRLSKLPAFENSAVVNDLKLRLSYGETGRSGFSRYISLARYQGWGRWQNDEGEWIQVYGPANNPNRDLHWERQKSYNVGVDFSLFDNKVGGSVDAFLRKGKDVIAEYDVPVPPYLHDKLFTNVGTTSSRGVELNLNWNAVNTGDFSYTTNIVATYTKSKLDAFSNDEFTRGYMDRRSLPSPGNPGFAQRLEDGVEIGSFYGYKYAGVDEDGNILIWKGGQEGTERILATEAGSETDRTYLGNGSPKYELSWGNTLTYKDFDLSVFFHGRFDYDILNLYQMYYGLTAEPNVNLLKDAFTRNAHIKSGKVITDYFLESGDYFKLDNLTLGWSPTIQSPWLKNLRVYATVRNLFTITKYSGLDPTTVAISGLEPGIGDLNVYPITRNYSLGVQVTF